LGEFVTVGRTEDVPQGELRAFTVGAEEVAIANVDGAFHAFGDTCSHQQCSLSDGDLDGVEVECVCHGSRFDVTTGEVMNPPATEPVPTFEVMVEDGELKVRG
jgi:nitrite reductase/ring-hydroxylating ferredoxin subunit